MVTSCETTLSSWRYPKFGYTTPEYRITFSYVVDGRVCEGSYVASAPEEYGHYFDILYDPNNPNRNTASSGTLIGIESSEPAKASRLKGHGS